MIVHIIGLILVILGAFNAAWVAGGLGAGRSWAPITTADVAFSVALVVGGSLLLGWLS